MALTVDAGDALLADIARTLKPDLLQLHGKETPQRTIEVRRLTGLNVMKAISVAGRDDLGAAARYAGADRLLLDAKPPKDATRPGGNAATFDWAVLDGFVAARPWLLAGGLTPENVGEALAVSGAAGVDVSSGVESAPGRKDAALIHAFVAAVRAFDRPQKRMAV